MTTSIAATLLMGSPNGYHLDGTPIQPIPSSRFPMPKAEEREPEDGLECPSVNSKETLVH